MRTTIKALVAALVLGTSAIASAAPCSEPVTAAPVTAAPVYTVTAKPVIVAQPIVTARPPITHPIIVVKPHKDWVDLGGAIQLRGEDSVAVGRNQGEFRTLQVVREGRGETKVKDVTITFANGQTQTVCLDKTLTTHDSALTIDLSGNYRFIQSVSITGESTGRAAIQLRAV